MNLTNKCLRFVIAESFYRRNPFASEAGGSSVASIARESVVKFYHNSLTIWLVI
jgi:hypothetical protein